MPTFRYRALTISKDIKAGTINAKNAAAAIVLLRAQGFTPIEAIEEHSRHLPAWKSITGQRSPSLSHARIGFFFQQLATLLQANVPLDRSLMFLADATDTPLERKIIGDLLLKVRSGADLSNALGSHPSIFSRSHVALIAAGEAGNTLGSSLARASHMEISLDVLQSKVFTALVYPAILLAASGVSLLLMFTVVVPQFEPLFQDSGATLPLATQVMLSIAHLVQNNWPLGLLSIATGLILISRLWRSSEYRSQIEKLILGVPLVGSAIIKVETSRFARTLGVLFDNGVPLPAALAIAETGIQNHVLRQAIKTVSAGIKEGESLARPLEATRLFPKIAVLLIQVGEESSTLSEMLERLADILERDVQRMVERFLIILVPIITVMLGIVIAAVIGSILIAVLSLNDFAT